MNKKGKTVGKAVGKTGEKTKGKALMFQGTGSNVGKSVLVAGLCRLAANRGIRVAPFKPQNMSNNAAVCDGGGEIGRAQALQARACGLLPQVEFNPVLLKPESDRTAQLIVNGQVVGTHDASRFRGKQRLSLMPQVLESFETLKRHYDLVLIEGAGSPAETNLRAGDIANMGFAEAADVPVSLIADIDRGGVIAALVGTKAVLSASDSKRIQSFIVNKFRGDVSLFTDGFNDIEQRTGWRGYGIVPWLPEVALLPPEDAVPLEHMNQDNAESGNGARLKIVAPALSRIANFDDLDPLRQEKGVSLEFIMPGRPIPLDADAVILLGTKSAIADMRFLREQGWDTDIKALVRAGKTVLGVCGGFQLLGQGISDPDGVDGSIGSEPGLGLLNITTRMRAGKTLRDNTGVHLESGALIKGYEIHVGETSGPDASRPFARLATGPDGAVSGDHRGRVSGTYLHGLFGNDRFRQHWLEQLRPGSSSDLNFEAAVDAALDQLGESLEACLDIDQLLGDAR